MTGVKILIIDLETAPKQAYVWRFFKENVGAKQVVGHGYIMSYAYKWLGEEEVHYSHTTTEDDRRLASEIRELFDEADVIVAHNAERFDIPTAKARMVVHRIAPPSPYKVVDTLRVAKKEFLFPSNSLEYLAEVLGVSPKKSHKKFPGFELWSECIKGNEEAWQEMMEYNIQDVITLEEIYLAMRPYIRNHPNLGILLEEGREMCPKCGSPHVQYRGYTTTQVGKYRKLQCQECGGWSRTRFTEYPKDKRKSLITNAV